MTSVLSAGGVRHHLPYLHRQQVPGGARHLPLLRQGVLLAVQVNSASCAENGAALVRQGGAGVGGVPEVMGDIALWMAGAEAENIKRCPMCAVPIERDAGCAQMMCKRCKHVFCWFCRESLDDDFLLRHYDSGKCKGKLGHSRVSVLWHRAQVVGIFAGFGILLLAASPFLLLAAPCIFCCRCKILDKLEAEANSRGSGIARSQ